MMTMLQRWDRDARTACSKMQSMHGHTVPSRQKSPVRKEWSQSRSHRRRGLMTNDSRSDYQILAFQPGRQKGEYHAVSAEPQGWPLCRGPKCPEPMFRISSSLKGSQCHG